MGETVGFKVVAVSVLFLLTTLSSVSAVQKNNDYLNGKHIFITSIDVSPFMILNKNDNGSFTGHGIIHEMMLWFTRRFNFTFTYTKTPDGFFGAFVNKSWNGMVGQLVNQEADLIAAQLGTLYARSFVIDFTTSFGREPMGGIIPAPTEESFEAAIVKPFQPAAWALIIFSMFAGTTVTWIFMVVISKYMSRFYSAGRTNLMFWEHFMYFFGIISCQGGRTMPSVGPLGHAPRIVAGVWCLGSVVLAYLYSGCLTSFIAIPKMRPLIESLDDLLLGGNDLKFATPKNSFLEADIFDSSSETFKFLAQSMRKHPETRLSSQEMEPENIYLKALNERLVIVYQTSLLEGAINIGYQKTNKCELAIMKKEAPSNTFDHMAVQKGSPYRTPVDIGLQEVCSFGLKDYWEKRYKEKLKCKENSGQGHKNRRLTLANLTGPFILLLIGMGLSCLIFLYEKIRFAVARR